MEQSQRECKWKPPIRKKGEDGFKVMKFPCRYPDQELTPELCTQCLMGDLFSLQFTQMSSMQKSFSIQEEMYAFLKNITDDGTLEDLK